jgi:hypothetical protein
MIQQYHAILEKSVDAGFVLVPALVPEERDLQGDIISAEVIEQAAHDYMQESQTVGLMHKAVAQGVVLVESYLARCDMEIAGVPVVKGTWLTGYRIYNQELRAAILSGVFNGVSIGGEGVRTDG